MPSTVIDRRQLLSGGGLALSSALISGNLFAANSTALSALLAGHRTGVRTDPASIKNFLAIHQSQKTRLVACSFDVHSVVQHPMRPEIFVAISKEQDSLQVLSGIDKDSPKISVNKAYQGGIFSGHGVFSPDGKLFITSETNKQTSSGILVVRDSVSFEPLDTIPSYGIYPHELRFIDGGKTLVAANGGFEYQGSSFVLIDFQTKKLIESHAPAAHGAGYRHFVLAESGNFLVGTWSRYGVDESKTIPQAEMVFGKIHKVDSAKVVPFGKKFENIPQRKASQFLSVAEHRETGRAALTVSSADVVAIVDLKTGETIQVLEKRNPTGVSLCQHPKHLAVASGDGYLQYLNMETMAWNPQLEAKDSLLTGSHLTYVTL